MIRHLALLSAGAACALALAGPAAADDENVFYRAYNSHDGYRRDLGYWERPSDRWTGYDCAWTTGCGYYPRQGYGYGYGSGYGYGAGYGYVRRYSYGRYGFGRRYDCDCGFGSGRDAPAWREDGDGERGVNADYAWANRRW